MIAAVPHPRRALAALLGLALVLGSVILWVGIPAGWLWLAGRLSSDYLMVWGIALFGCPPTMALWALLLGRLNGAYLRAAGGHPDQQHSAWLHSLSGGRRPYRAGSTLLDVSLTVSVLIALVALLVFFFLSQNYEPGRIL